MKLFEVGFVFGKMISDGVMTFLALLFAWFVRMAWYDNAFFSWLGLSDPTTLYPFGSFVELAVKIALILVALMALGGRYQIDVEEKISEEIGKTIVTYTLGFAVLVVLFYFTQLFFFSRAIFGIAWLAGLILTLTGRGLLRSKRRWLHRLGFGRRKMLLLGVENVAPEVIEHILENPKYEVVGILSEKKTTKKSLKGVKIEGTFAQFEEKLQELKPDEVLLVSDHSSDFLNTQLAKTAHIYHVKFSFLPDELGMDLAAVQVSILGNSPLITLLHTKITGWGSLLKGFIDFVFSGIALVVLSPIMLFCAIIVFIESPRAPIIYKSRRVGKDGKEFNCYKFRSMVPDADEQKKKLKNQRKGGVLFKVENDPRITKVGKFLRKWSLDEFPQFFNVFIGNMSLIGPRPHLPEEVKKYNKDDLRVLSVRPGITGFAQIHGRSNLSYEEEMKYELFYLKNWSFWLDFIIAIKSFFVIVKRENIDVK